MLALIKNGGAKRSKKPSGHATREGSFSVDNGGSIAPNIFQIPNSGDQAYTKACRDAGLPAHPARMPIALASKMIEFLSRPDEIVFDPFAGFGTTARAAENLGRSEAHTSELPSLMRTSYAVLFFNKQKQPK